VDHYQLGELITKTKNNRAFEVLICKHTSGQFALKAVQKASHNEHSIRMLYLKIKQTFLAKYNEKRNNKFH